MGPAWWGAGKSTQVTVVEVVGGEWGTIFNLKMDVQDLED